MDKGKKMVEDMTKIEFNYKTYSLITAVLLAIIDIGVTIFFIIVCWEILYIILNNI